MTRKLALVTGGAQRLGRVFALALARHGFAIGLHYRHSAQEASWTKKEIESLGVPAYLLRADLKQPEKISQLFSIVREFDEPLKVLVNSAAIMQAGQARGMPVEDWDATLDLNLRAPFLMAQEAARLMDAGGLIVNVSDIGAQKSWSGYPAYTVSKAGLESLTRVLARAFAPSIRVNAIAPGLVIQSETIAPEEWDRLIQRLPLQRAGRPDEISAALEFLILNEYITGQTIIVDGGYSLI